MPSTRFTASITWFLRRARCLRLMRLPRALALSEEGELLVIADGAQVGRPFVEERPRVGDGRVVDRRPVFGEEVVEHERGLQVANLQLEIVGEIPLNGDDG